MPPNGALRTLPCNYLIKSSSTSAKQRMRRSTTYSTNPNMGLKSSSTHKSRGYPRDHTHQSQLSYSTLRVRFLAFWHKEIFTPDRGKWWLWKEWMIYSNCTEGICLIMCFKKWRIFSVAKRKDDVTQKERICTRAWWENYRWMKKFDTIEANTSFILASTQFLKIFC